MPDPQKLKPQIKLWFFRDLTEEQRLGLYALCGIPKPKDGQRFTHAGEHRILFEHIFGRATPPEDNTLREALEQARDVLRDCRDRGSYIPDFVFERIDAALSKASKTEVVGHDE